MTASKETDKDAKKSVDETIELQMDELQDSLCDSFKISKADANGHKKRESENNKILSIEPVQFRRESNFTLGNMLEEEKEPQVNNDMILNGKKLVLKVQSSITSQMIEENLPKKATKYEITPMGYAKSKRGTSDSVVYFGTPDVRKVSDEQKSGRNDIELDLEGMAKGTRFFKIYYSNNANRYFLKDLGEGPGVFVRVDKRTPLKQGAIITFGQQHLVVNYKLSQDVDPGHKITLQLIEDGKVVRQQ